MLADLAAFGAANWLALLVYSGIFLLSGCLWSCGVFRKQLRLWSWPGLVAALFGAVALWLTLRLQPPILQWLAAKGQASGLSVYIYGFGLTLTTGIVQELLKALAMLLPALFWRRRDWLALGILAGLGFGVWEACRLAAWPLGQQAIWAAVPVIERFFAIGFHVASAAFTGYGLQTRRPLPWLGLAIVSHGVGNYIAVLYQQWVFGLFVCEALLAIFDLALVYLACRLARRARNEVTS